MSTAPRRFPTLSTSRHTSLSNSRPGLGFRPGSSRITIVFAFLALSLAPGLGFLKENASRASALAVRASAVSRRWTIVRKVQTQDQGDWQIDYVVRLESPSAATLNPADLALIVRGWLSNSRVAAHAVPRPVSTALSAKSGANVLTEVIPSGDELGKCRERLIARFWSGDSESPPSACAIANHLPLAPPGALIYEPLPTVIVPAQGVLRIRLRLEHDHFLHGPYDPLLGVREVELKLGPDLLRDTLALDREQYLAQGRDGWATPPEDRRDTRHFVSPPDSLSLEAHVPGNHYYRFAEKPVRYSTKMRLSFWYLIAPGTEGDFRVQVAQYKDSPHGWQVLHAGAIENTYTKVGRWAKVEQTFRTEPQATSIALVFKVMTPNDVGEVWIDDVKLEPVAGTGDRP